jgi:hypothetical protein
VVDRHDGHSKPDDKGIDFAVFPFRLFRPRDAKRMAITTGNALAT